MGEWAKEGSKHAPRFEECGMRGGKGKGKVKGRGKGEEWRAEGSGGGKVYAKLTGLLAG